MIPLRDINPTRTVPVVNYVLIALNVLGFALQMSLIGAGALGIVEGYGVVPTRMLADPPGETFTIFTAMFMHGDLSHLAGNLLFLYIFGDNVEDAVGHGRYVIFYALAGIAAAVGQIVVGPDSTIPMIGASGAISGVMGAYLVLYPRAPVTVLNPIFPLWFVFGIFLVFPAWLVVGEWFVWNLISGVGSLGAQAGPGVAFFAHIGGFIAGLLLVRPMMAGRDRRQHSNWDGWRSPPGGRFGGGGSFGSRGSRRPRFPSDRWH